jgi:hypothetical protein
LGVRGKIRAAMPTGYYALSGLIYLVLSASSGALWFFPAGLAVLSLTASYGLYSRRSWGWLISAMSSSLGIVCWGTSLYASIAITGNPLAEDASPSASIALTIDLALASMLLLSIISLIYVYMRRGSFSDRG